MTDVNGMSLNFIGGGVRGSNLVDCQVLCIGESIGEISEVVSSGRVELWKYGGKFNIGNVIVSDEERDSYED